LADDAPSGPDVFLATPARMRHGRASWQRRSGSAAYPSSGTGRSRPARPGTAISDERSPRPDASWSRGLAIRSPRNGCSRRRARQSSQCTCAGPIRNSAASIRLSRNSGRQPDRLAARPGFARFRRSAGSGPEDRRRRSRLGDGTCRLGSTPLSAPSRPIQRVAASNSLGDGRRALRVRWGWWRYALLVAHAAEADGSDSCAAGARRFREARHAYFRGRGDNQAV
jgi:hypothetical protein